MNFKLSKLQFKHRPSVSDVRGFCHSKVLLVKKQQHFKTELRQYVFTVHVNIRTALLGQRLSWDGTVHILWALTAQIVCCEGYSHIGRTGLSVHR